MHFTACYEPLLEPGHTAGLFWSSGKLWPCSVSGGQSWTLVSFTLEKHEPIGSIPIMKTLLVAVHWWWQLFETCGNNGYDWNVVLQWRKHTYWSTQWYFPFYSPIRMFTLLIRGWNEEEGRVQTGADVQWWLSYLNPIPLLVAYKAFRVVSTCWQIGCWEFKWCACRMRGCQSAVMGIKKRRFGVKPRKYIYQWKKCRGIKTSKNLCFQLRECDCDMTIIKFLKLARVWVSVTLRILEKTRSCQ